MKGGQDRKYRFSKADVVERWAKHDGRWRWPSVARWLSSLQAQGMRCYYLFLFCEWACKNPHELLVLKDGGLEAEYLLDRFAGLDDSEDAPYVNSVMWNCVQAVRSFCKKNYHSLEPCAGQMTLNKVNAYRKHSPLQLRQILDACYNPRDKSMVATVFCSAIAKETLTELRWSHFEEDWRKQEIPHISVPDTLLKGHGRGRWKGVEQHTFLTPEAKRLLLEYESWVLRVKGVTFSRDSYVYVGLHPPYEKLSYSRMGKISFDICSRLPFKWNWHDGRRYVHTALEDAGLKRNWIQKVKGRKVRGEDSPYSLPEVERLREKYRGALSCLCFLDVEAETAKREMSSLKLSLGETTARERELSRRIAELEGKVDTFVRFADHPEFGSKFKRFLEGLEKEKR